jgi:hypothetical protein
MPSMSLGSWSSTVALVLVVLGVDGCCGRFSKCGPNPGERPEVSPGAPRVLPPPRTGEPSPSPELAVVVTADGVVAIDAKGERVLLVAPQTDVSWCRVDPHGRVLWLRHGEQGSLSLVDLESDAPPILVLERAPETVIIAYPGHELGRPEAHEFQDAVVVHMDEPQRVEPALGCDGDQAYYCYDEIDDLAAAEAKRLAEIRAMLEGQPLLGRDALAEVYQRSTAPAPRQAPQSPEPELVRTVPREPCTEEPNDCGSAMRLPGTPYWLVVVANSRGDFFYETRQLYDPATSEFFDPRDAKARSPQPLAESGETFVPTWVSPSGKLALDHDALVSFERGTVASGFQQVCGFWGGGWETPRHR